MNFHPFIRCQLHDGEFKFKTASSSSPVGKIQIINHHFNKSRNTINNEIDGTGKNLDRLIKENNRGR